jgi:hypothetical protein
MEILGFFLINDPLLAVLIGLYGLISYLPNPNGADCCLIGLKPDKLLNFFYIYILSFDYSLL